MTTGHARFKRHLLPLALYSLMALGVTYPLAAHLGDRIAGSGDAPWFLWQLWWFKHALIDLARTPLTTDLIFYPASQVAVNWQTPVNELFFLPLHLAAGTVLYYNLLILSSFILSGYFMHLLVLRLLKQPRLAFVAGVIFAFNAYHSTRALGHLSLASTQWLPLALLLLYQAWRAPSARRGAAAGVGVALVMLASPYYAAYFLLPVLVCAAAYAAATRKWAALARPQAGRMAAALVAAAGILSTPFYLDYLSSSPEMKEAALAAARSVSVYVADVLSWVLPPKENPLWGPVTAPIYEKYSAGYLRESALFFGFLPPLLALYAVLRHKKHPRQVLFWGLLAAAAWLLAFGPELNVWGERVLGWMPYRLFMALPGSYAFRAPARLGVTAILAATVAAMFTVKRWMDLKPRWPWTSLMAIWSALLVANLSVGFPFQTSSAQIPPVYDAVAAAPGAFAILDLPSGELFLEDAAWQMYYQTRHQKRLVSGYLGRRPQSLIAQTAALPFANRFFVEDYDSYFSGDWAKLVRWPQPGTGWPDDIRNGGTHLADLGIRYVILHKGAADRGFSESAALLLNHALGPPDYADADALRFEARRASLISKNAPAFTFDVPARYLAGTVAAEAREHFDARTLVLGQGKTDVAAFELPVPGVWRIQGVLEGKEAAAVRLTIDGQEAARTAQLSEEAYAFAFEGFFAAGAHTLRATYAPAAAAEQAVVDALDLYARPQALALPQLSQPVDFHNNDGNRFRLLAAGVVTAPGPAGAARRYLYTAWQELEPGRRITAQEGLTQFTHLTGPGGETLAQADHLLGAQGIVRTDLASSTGAQGLIDFVALPEAAGIPPDATIRIGLWRPEVKDYYWVVGPAQVDEGGRLLLGAVGDLEAAQAGGAQ